MLFSSAAAAAATSPDNINSSAPAATVSACNLVRIARFNVSGAGAASMVTACVRNGFAWSARVPACSDIASFCVCESAQMEARTRARWRE